MIDPRFDCVLAGKLQQQQVPRSRLVAQVNCNRRETANTYCVSSTRLAESSGAGAPCGSAQQPLAAFPSTVADRVSSSAAQQESGLQQQQTDTDNRSTAVAATEATKDCARKAECFGQQQQRSPPQKGPQEQPQQHRLLAAADRAERKRKRIDSSTLASCSKEVRNRQVALVAGSRDSRDTSRSGNNMTPSSLLLIQSNHHLKKRQQSDQAEEQQTNSGGGSVDNGGSGAKQRVGLSATALVGQDSVAKQASVVDGLQQPISTPTVCADASEQVTTITQTPSFSQSDATQTSSSSAHMLSSAAAAERFRISNSIEASNTSAVNTINSANCNNIANSSSKRVEPPVYLPRDCLNQAQIRTNTSQTDAAAAAVVAGSSDRLGLQQSYQQNLAACDLRLTGGLSHSAQYKASNDRFSNQYYNSNFMLNQQVKPLDALGLRTVGFDENSNSTRSYDRNETNLETTNLNAAQQQARSAYQYYGGQYSLIPTVSSKSSSPNSVNSTPSPRTHTMRAINVANHHSNQLLAAGLGGTSSVNISAAESHLEQLNHHYMNSNNASSAGTSSQQHQQQQQQQQQLQLNQHYSYNQQTTGESNQQQHLAIVNHEAAYNHHQQQQRHAQLNVANQQSIYQIPNNSSSSSASMNHSNYSSSAGHYQGHLQAAGMNNHQTSNLMVDAHQNHLNSAAAACAAAVVSCTLKTVANQHNQHHQNHYGSSTQNGFASNPGNLVNITAQHHQQFHNVNPLNAQQHWAQSQTVNMQQNHNHQVVHQQHQSSLPAHQAAAVVTRKYQCKMCPQVS